MDPSGREKLEERIRAKYDRGDLAAAATLALQSYGPEIYGFLVTTHRNADAASEVFSAFSERLWSGLAGFEWKSSFRTWAFAVARHESLRYLRDTGRRQKRLTPLQSSLASAVAEQVRLDTAAHLRTEAKSKMALLRDRLDPDDRALLLLRIDKKLEWPDAARILSGDETLEGPALKKEAARLRKRFQLLKQRLLELGRREGLLPGESTDG